MTIRITKTNGVFEKGKVYVLEDRLARMLVRQNMAEEFTPPGSVVATPNKSMKPEQIKRGGL
jgi:hypothetical protein